MNYTFIKILLLARYHILDVLNEINQYLYMEAMHVRGVGAKCSASKYKNLLYYTALTNEPL